MEKEEYIKMIHFAHKYASKYDGKEYERSYKDYIKGYEDAHALCSPKLKRITTTSESGLYRCLLCGRDKFTRKSPHKCIDGFRKHNLVFQKIKKV